MSYRYALFIDMQFKRDYESGHVAIENARNLQHRFPSSDVIVKVHRDECDYNTNPPKKKQEYGWPSYMRSD